MMAPPLMLALPAVPPDYGGDGVVAPLRLARGWKEAAGYAFHEQGRRVLGLVPSLNTNGVEEVSPTTEKDEDARMRAEWEKKHKKRAAGVENDDENLYEVLEIGHLGFNASSKQLRKAYQKMLLKYHPDKNENVDETDPRFLAVQRAWDVLGNDTKRRGYDSQFEFDESVPSESQCSTATADDDGFFELLAPVFLRNARFSEKKPVPSLGNNETPISSVREFYAFWDRFRSWRDFSKFDEFHSGDLEEAESREERRWMTRQNEKSREKRKRKEYERIRTMVERARRYDPRVARAKSEAKRAKQEAKEAKERARRESELVLLARMAARAAAEAKEQAAAAAAALRKEVAAAEKRERARAKKDLKRAVKTLLRLWKHAASVVEKTDPSAKCDLADLETVCDLQSNKPPTLELLQRLVAAFDGLECEPGSEADTHKSKSAADFGKEEAAAKAGIAAVAAASAESRSAAEALQEERRAAQERSASIALASAARKKSANDVARVCPCIYSNSRATYLAVMCRSQARKWGVSEAALLAKAVAKFPGGTRNRWQAISSYVNANSSTMVGAPGDRSCDECISKAKVLNSERGAGLSAATAFNHFRTQPRKVDPKKEIARAQAMGGCVKSEKDTRGIAAKANPPNAPQIWTQDQQRQLEAALKEFPASMEKNERWKSIAKAVSGKSKKECVARFKELRQSVLKAKLARS